MPELAEAGVTCPTDGELDPTPFDCSVAALEKKVSDDAPPPVAEGQSAMALEAGQLAGTPAIGLGGHSSAAA